MPSTFDRSNNNRSSRGSAAAGHSGGGNPDGGWNDYFDGSSGGYNEGWNQMQQQAGGWNSNYDQDGNNNNNNWNGYGFNEMMMRRNSLMENMGGGMMRRGSMGFGYNNFGYYGYGGYQQGTNGMNQGMGNINNNMVNQGDGNAGPMLDKEEEELLELDDPDEEDNIDYLAARAHAAQMLAQEEARRLEDNLRRLEARRKRGGKSNPSAIGNTGTAGNGNPGMTSPQAGQQPNNMQQMNLQPINMNMQMMPPQDYINPTFFNMNMPNNNNNVPNNNMNANNSTPNSNSMNIPNNIMPNTNDNMVNGAAMDSNNSMLNSNSPNKMPNPNNNMNNSNNNTSNNAQSKDDYLFERSRMNNYQMNMRNATVMDGNNNNNNSNNNNYMGFNQGFNGNMNQFQGYNNNNFNKGNMNQFQYNNMNMGYGYAIMPTHNTMNQNNMMNGTGNAVNNTMASSANISSNSGGNNNDANDKEKKRKRPTITDPSDLPVVPPPKHKDVTTIRRPLSAYNIFFSEMREVLLKEGGVKNDKWSDGGGTDDNAAAAAAAANDSELKPTFDNSNPDKSTNANPKQTQDTPPLPTFNAQSQNMQEFTKSLMAKRLHSTPSRRPHRKTHGTIGFTSLVQTISKMWRALSEEDKVKYKEVAELDRERYKKEKARVLKEKREDAKRARRLARQVPVGSGGGDGGGGNGNETG